MSSHCSEGPAVGISRARVEGTPDRRGRVITALNLNLGLMVLLVLTALGGAARGENVTIEDFSGAGANDWRFFTDQVMGGISEGQAQVETIAGETALHLTGSVSTANRGGFIQARLDLDATLPPNSKGIIVRARGDGQRYFIHLRTSGSVLPWQYYQAGFETTSEWQEIRLPWSAFEPSGRMLRDVPESQAVRSVALVAYGRDHEADVSVAEIGTF